MLGDEEVECEIKKYGGEYACDDGEYDVPYAKYAWGNFHPFSKSSEYS